MPELKKQHFVPKLYLKNFTYNGKHFNVYNILQGKTIKDAYYDSQCYKNYYYGKDKIWEKRLSDLETNWRKVFTKVLGNKMLDSDDKSLIKQFALYQLHRTYAMNEYLRKQREEFLCEYGRVLYKRYGMVFDSNAESICKERASLESTPAESLAYADKFIPEIDDLDIVIIHYNTTQELITSDVPVIPINQFHTPSIGYNNMGLILLFPISSEKLIVIYDSKMYPDNKEFLYVESFDETEVINLNILQFISADKVLISKTENMFVNIADMAMEARMRNRDQRTMAFLGTDDNRLMIDEPRKVIYNCSFSFGRVCHAFTRIPFVCKEGIPRKWDKEWEKKLQVKEQILPDILAKNPHLLLDYGITVKEIRRGCKRMTMAVRRYWTKVE